MQASPLLWIFDFSNTIAANWHYFYPTLFPQLTICNSESLPIVAILSTEFFLENLKDFKKNCEYYAMRYMISLGLTNPNPNPIKTWPFSFDSDFDFDSQREKEKEYRLS